MLIAFCLIYVALLSLYLANSARRQPLWPRAPVPAPVFTAAGYTGLAGGLWWCQRVYGWEVGITLWITALSACGLVVMASVGFWPAWR
jgi:hypothetical protein